MKDICVFLCFCTLAGAGEMALPSEAADVKSKSASGTVELIRSQVVRAKEHASQVGVEASQAERTKAELQGQAEKDRVEKQSQNGGARPDTPPLSAAEVAAMRDRAAQYAEYMKRVGEAKAAQKEREAEEKSAELQRQADDLEHQLTDENYSRHRDIKLNPVGTNLYVRNYSQITPTVKPLKAHAASLSGTASSLQTTLQVRSTRSTSTNSRSIGNGTGAVLRKTDVRGKLLPQ